MAETFAPHSQASTRFNQTADLQRKVTIKVAKPQGMASICESLFMRTNTWGHLVASARLNGIKPVVANPEMGILRASRPPGNKLRAYRVGIIKPFQRQPRRLSRVKITRQL
jgi:hypothetical protein